MARKQRACLAKMDMRVREAYDAVVVGSGPNGLAAAITLAQNGLTVLVVEANASIGGAARSDQGTLPGFVHDVCSAVYPLGAGSPFFNSLPLAEFGLRWVHPELPLAHPMDDGSAAVLHRSIPATAQGLGKDGEAYTQLMERLSGSWNGLKKDILGPPHWPADMGALFSFGIRAMQPASVLASRLFEGEHASGLFAGLAAHSFLPLDYPFSSSFGLLLGVAGHTVGWPFAGGGSQSIPDALAGYFRCLGGEIQTGWRVEHLDELPRAKAVLLDLTPRQVLRIGRGKIGQRYAESLAKFKYGPAAFKVDYALDGPVPWIAPECRRAGTIHLGGTFGEIAHAERAAWDGRIPERPFVLVAQPALVDPERAPAGKQTLWAYCHVPHRCEVDMTDRLESQIERFAPGFRERILARRVMGPLELQRNNANCVGGDISGGAHSWDQLLTRPMVRWDPYPTDLRGLYICSASTSPGGGVHGMCGYHAARSALKREFGIRPAEL